MTFEQTSSSFQSLAESSLNYSTAIRCPSEGTVNSNNVDVQEPMPFEDFKINFGINPDIFATPGSLTIDLALAQLQQQHQHQPSFTSNTTSFINPFLPPEQPPLFEPTFNSAASSLLPFPLPTTAMPPSQDLTAASVLDEDDQKAFSNFLDAFFIDDMQLIDDSTPAAATGTSGSHPTDNSGYIAQQTVDHEEQEELRRSSILQSLDEQKRLHQKLNLIASLPQFSSSKYNSSSSHSTTLSDLMIPSTPAHEPSHSLETPPVAEKGSSKGKKEAESTAATVPESIFLKRSEYFTPSCTSIHTTPPPPRQQEAPLSPIIVSSPTATKCDSMDTANNKKKRPFVASVQGQEEETANRHKKAKRSRTIYRELLSEEEKRANHIASEQKRRTTIRNGFKELTELVPTLKNVNNSKSNVLFKAVEFIHHLKMRNKGLAEKIRSLELRAEVEGRVSRDQQLCDYRTVSTETNACTTSCTSAVSSKDETQALRRPAKARRLSGSTTSSNSSTSSTSNSSDTICTTDSTSSSTHQTQFSVDTNSYASHKTAAYKTSSVSASARNAILAHKKQEKQLLLLQEQLQLHQKLIADREQQKELSIHRHVAAFRTATVVHQPQRKPVHIKAEPHSL